MRLLPAKRSSAGGDTPPWRREVPLQGPRPPPLSVNKESRKIGKPAKAAKPPKPAARQPTTENREPVVIYAVSPKTINIDASEFKSIVQRLTGLGSSTTPCSFAGGPISPAARLAAIEKASPTGRERGREKAAASSELDLMGMVDVGQIPGILSLAPANLPDLPAGMFTPAAESQGLFGLGDNMMSPFGGGSYLIHSPISSSCFFTGGVGLSPTPSPVLDFSAIFY